MREMFPLLLLGGFGGWVMMGVRKRLNGALTLFGWVAVVVGIEWRKTELNMAIFI